MMTFHRGGFYFEMFPINGVPKHNSHFESVLQELGMQDEVKTIYPERTGVILYEDEKGVLRSWDMDTPSILMLPALGVRLWNLREVWQTFNFLRHMATLPPEKIEELYDTPAMDYVNNFRNRPGACYSWFLCN